MLPPGDAGGNLTLDIDTAGSITIAGQSVTFNLGTALSTQGSITVQGQTVTPSLGLAVSNGSITLQGQSVTFGLGLALSTQGSITINGQSVTLDNGIALAIDTPGSITLQGQAVAFNLGTALGNGSITLQGQSTGLSLGASVANGAITIQGQSLTTAFGVSPTVGSITINGQTVALDLAGSLTLAIDVPGSITIAGQTVNLVNVEPTPTKVGGDDRIRRSPHRGYGTKRALLKRDEEQRQLAEIRAIYRELMGFAPIAERAEQVLVSIEPEGETEQAYSEYQARKSAIIEQRLETLGALGVESEIALRLLYKELRELKELDDETVIQQLLAELL